MSKLDFDSPEYAASTWARLVERSSIAESGCWIWNGARDRHGYGRIKWKNEARFTHRVAYEIARGRISSGLVLDHLCRNTSCFNPDHLEPVPQRTNLLRGETVSAARAAVTHCPQGHEYDLVNTYRSKQGQRHCRACMKARHQRGWVSR